MGVSGDENNIRIEGMIPNVTDEQIDSLVFPQKHIRGGVQQYISLRTYLAPAPVATYFEDRTHSLHRVIVDCGSPEHLVE